LNKHLAIGDRKERSHFPKYRVDDRLCRGVDRTTEGLGRTLARVDFDDLATDEHQVARPVQCMPQKIIEDGLRLCDKPMLDQLIRLANQPQHGVGVFGVDKALPRGNFDIL
jgi:hypothetical protein